MDVFPFERGCITQRRYETTLPFPKRALCMAEVKENMIICSRCGKTIVNPKNHVGTGYATYRGSEKKVCYKCVGILDREAMNKLKPGQKYDLYLTKRGGKYFVSNWCDTLKYPVYTLSTGRHNMAGTRTDVWFKDGRKRWWHGVQYGDNSDICRCQLLKHTPDFVR